MYVRIVVVAAATALLGAAVVQGSAPPPVGQLELKDATPITVVGCVQRESDYRRQMGIRRGGFLNTGLGDGDEYVLVNTANGDCSSLSGASGAYELSGDDEEDLEPFVGRRVEVAGLLKRADVGDDGRPEGGFDPLGGDLRLYEVNFDSFREAPMVLARAQAPQGEPADIETAPVGDEDVTYQQLPRTASPLALAGLLGLLAAGGGIGVRAIRRRLLSLR